MATTKANFENPGMVMVATFLALLAANVILVYLANLAFPYWIVLGTITIPPLWGLFHSMGVLALIATFAIPFVRVYEKGRGKMFDAKEWAVAGFLINLAGIWVIARFPDQFGLGIRAWVVAAGLALVLDLVGGVIMMQLEKVRTKLS